MTTPGSSIFQAPMQKSVYDQNQNDIVDEAEVAVPSAHDLSGALHNASTLANLNNKVSDATLDDSGDPRDPNAHASDHTDGTDDIQNATNGQKGLSTAAQVTAQEANTTHSGGDGSDHADVATNTTHSGGDGSDHADVAANTTHRGLTNDPHNVTQSQVGLSNVDNTSDADKPVSTAQQTALDLKVDDTEKGAANGVATLDAGTKVPAAQLPNSIMNYKGTWAASTNTPALANGSGSAGDVYVSSDAGTVDFGAGNITFAAGDWVIYSGSIWEKSVNSNAVASVFSRTGAVVAASNDYTWAQIDKTTSDIADITTKSHTSLTDKGTKTHATLDSEVNANNAKVGVTTQISNVVEDTTPQLGGTLDSNSKQVRWSKGSDVASAGALTLGTDGNYFDITGTTTITSIGSLAIGTVVRLHFDGILILTHHATNLVLPTGVNITTAAGDEVVFIEYASGDWRCVNYQRADGTPLAGGGAEATSMWIPAAAMKPAVTNGCSNLISEETTALRPDITVLKFDASSDEHAQFSVKFPSNWDIGTVTFRAFWKSTAADTDGIAIALQGVAVADGGTIDVAYGTAVVVTDDAQSTDEDLYITAESGNITIAGTPSSDKLIFFQIYRDVSDANDDMAEDMSLIGIELFYTIA